MTKQTNFTTTLIISITIVISAFIVGRLSITSNLITGLRSTISSSIDTAGQTHHEQTTTTVLITGATGRTGSLLYSILSTQKQYEHVTLRALVRNVTKAREVLHCTHCDERDGIFVGDVTQPEDLTRAARGVDTLVILSSSGFGNTVEEQKAVEFDGVVNSVAALAQDVNRVEDEGGDDTRHLRVVLCSSMGTTRFMGDAFGQILFWKLNAEAFLGTAGIGSAIVKPCGLTNDAGGDATLLVGHHDSISINEDGNRYPITREDVAAVMAQAVLSRSEGLRFDLCAMPGPATTDLEGLLTEARWAWDN